MDGSDDMVFRTVTYVKGHWAETMLEVERDGIVGITSYKRQRAVLISDRRWKRMQAALAAGGSPAGEQTQDGS